MTNFQDVFFQYVDDHTELYISRLAEAVAIPSISSNLDKHLPDIVRIMTWTKDRIERLGGKATLLDNPATTKEKEYPPILLGEFTSDPKKKTVCVYGHLDVQPASKSDGWDSDPFVLTERDGKLYGRGSTDDKGPALSWLWVVEAHKLLGVELPVNVKLIYEGMEVSRAGPCQFRRKT
jgi:acetylornithine deacetylase/succinyl-diaminopimelate desuccinylase-like protein